MPKSVDSLFLARTMNRFNPIVLVGLLLSSVLFSALAGRTDGNRPYVLFIAIDDLRPELGCYGSPIAKSPNLDKLAGEGMRFDRAYCQQSICSPSRASLMTGARPDQIGVIENTAYFRELNPDVVTLPQHFIKHGYEAVYCGKIYHARMTDDHHSWSRKPAYDRCPKMKWLPGNYALKENQELWASNKEKMLAKYGKAGSGGLIHGPAYEAADVEDHVYGDGFSTRLAIATLEDHLERKPSQPLFLALGFKKPHLDFVAPKKYWDLYDRDEIELASQTKSPKGGAATGLHASFELRTRHGIPKSGPIGPDLARTLLHGYYACVSYVDAQIGMMLEALDQAGIREDTVIMVWGDHGWHLGEKQRWRKFTLWEEATRAPLIWYAPGVTKADTVCSRPVDFLSIYPTLCELAGIDIPSHVEGRSIVSLLKDPQAKWDGVAITTNGYMNHSIRNENWRYTRYQDGSEELYDHLKDPYEWKNLADREGFESVKKRLAAHLPKKNAPKTPTKKPSKNKKPKKEG